MSALVESPPGAEGVVHRMPQTSFAKWTQLRVRSDQAALFIRDGRCVGLLGAGTHTLEPSTYPFLDALTSAHPPHPYQAQLVFVRAQPFLTPVNGMLSLPSAGGSEAVRVSGHVKMRVSDPVRFMLTPASEQFDRRRGELVMAWLESAVAPLVVAGDASPDSLALRQAAIESSMREHVQRALDGCIEFMGLEGVRFKRKASTFGSSQGPRPAPPEAPAGTFGSSAQVGPVTFDVPTFDVGGVALGAAASASTAAAPWSPQPGEAATWRDETRAVPVTVERSMAEVRWPDGSVSVVPTASLTPRNG